MNTIVAVVILIAAVNVPIVIVQVILTMTAIVAALWAMAALVHRYSPWQLLALIWLLRVTTQQPSGFMSETDDCNYKAK
jgi:hypothetical protein